MDKAVKKRLGTGLYASGILLALAGMLSWLALSNFAQAIALFGVGLITAGAGLFINHSYRTRQGTARTVLYALLVIGALIMMFPFYWMISSSFKTSAEMSIYPPTWSPRNWRRRWPRCRPRWAWTCPSSPRPPRPGPAPTPT